MVYLFQIYAPYRVGDRASSAAETGSCSADEEAAIRLAVRSSHPAVTSETAPYDPSGGNNDGKHAQPFCIAKGSLLFALDCTRAEWSYFYEKKQ